MMDPRGLRVTKNAYFLLLTHTKKLLLETYCDPTADTGVSFPASMEPHAESYTEPYIEPRLDRQTDVTVKIVI